MGSGDGGTEVRVDTERRGSVSYGGQGPVRKENIESRLRREKESLESESNEVGERT